MKQSKSITCQLGYKAVVARLSKPIKSKLWTLCALTLANTVCVSTSAEASAWGYDNHRIAVSADGNNQPDKLHRWPQGDPDDWGGTPAALAMIAKAKLQDKLVHYSYNNFIDAPPHTTFVNHMKIGADGAIERWDFNPQIFFDASEDSKVAIDHLAKQIALSSETDPLYFIHMGPAEFFYRVVDTVIESGDSDALTHVYVVSHSGYNDNHLRRGDAKFDLKPVATSDKHHTMAEVLELSEHRLNFKKIQDQNAEWDINHLWSSGDDFSVWYWMRDHQDPNVRWIYERMLENEKGVADISDAGMVFWLLEGDENGSPAKFEAFIGDGI
ncbi:hypothetical protein [Vibrio sp. WXL103]|uniref:hypothetical protein n=1 Tax=Vibrio sp. WXL103 TaxID=3450710 RepID=UPI003EC50F09